MGASRATPLWEDSGMTAGFKGARLERRRADRELLV